MAYGYFLEAQYEDGYVHREDEQDHSPYVHGANIFNDILHRRPEQAHGKMVRFSIVGSGKKLDIDWSELPDNAKPIYFRRMAQDFNQMTGPSEPRVLGHWFGYEYVDGKGEKVQEIREL